MEINKTDLIKKAIEELNKAQKITVGPTTPMTSISAHTPIDEDHEDWGTYLDEFRCPHCGRLITCITEREDVTQYKSYQRSDNPNSTFDCDIDDETTNDSEIDYECNHCHTMLEDAFRDRFHELS